MAGSRIPAVLRRQRRRVSSTRSQIGAAGDCAPDDRSEDTEVRARRPHRRASHARHTAATCAKRASATSGAGVACLGPSGPAPLAGGVPLPPQGKLAAGSAAGAWAPVVVGGACNDLGSGLAVLLTPGVSAPRPLSVVAALPGLARGQTPAVPATGQGKQPRPRVPAALPSPAPAPGAVDPSAGGGPCAPCSAAHAAWNSGSRQRAPAGLAAGAALDAKGGVFGSTFSSAPLPELVLP